MKVSVIIPVYNAEKTIEHTIESIQSKYQHEIICINDGSTDETEAVISNIDNPRIKLITRENKGASASRNEGIEYAKGEYIMFCDADDKLTPYAIDHMVELIETNGTDAVIGQIAHSIGEKVIPIQTYKDLLPQKVTTLKESPEIMQSIGPYGKLYKKSKLNGYRFSEDITFCEEHLFNLQIWLNSKMTITEKVSYLYNIGNEDSIIANSYKKLPKYLDDATKVRKNVNTLFNNTTLKIKEYYSYRMDYLIVYFLIRNNFYKSKEISKVNAGLRQYLKQINNIDTKSTFILKKISQQLATKEGYNYFENLSKELQMDSSKKSFYSSVIQLKKLTFKMKLRYIYKKLKKSSH